MNLESTLQGNFDWVSWSPVGVTASVYIALLVFHCLFRRPFIALVEKPETVCRFWIWDFLFFSSQGVITVLIVPLAGVFLAYVFLMLPAALALLFTRRWIPALVLGWAAGMVSCSLGLTASYFTGRPYGPTLVLSMGAFFLGALLIRSPVPARGPTLEKEVVHAGP